MDQQLTAKTSRLKELLQSYKRLLIAYSGGVDSSLLAAAAARFIPGDYLAVTFATPFHPQKEIQEAKDLAQKAGFAFRELVIANPDIPEIWSNQQKRCYYCKKALFNTLYDLAKAEGYSFIADGSNLDDEKAWRPGLQALKELGIKSPLREAGFTKADIRQVAKAWGLDNYQKPPRPCLLSRFPYQTAITRQMLRQVEAGEELLAAFGFADYRLRHHGKLCRLELPKDDWPHFLANAAKITAALKELGYDHVTLDLQGLRSGCFDDQQ